MYKKIMVPVDLAHIERIDKALATAADLAVHYGIPVCYVGVTTGAPSEVAHTFKEYAQLAIHEPQAGAVTRAR